VLYLCRMTKSERTRQFIVEKTAPLFNMKGFDGTSLSDLTEATGLTKGALYGNFEDKDEIAVAAFRYSVKKVKRMVRDHLIAGNNSKQQLTLLLEFYARYVFNPPLVGGCPLLNSAIEADDHRTSMRKIVAAELVSTVEFIASLLKKGVKAKEFRADIKPRQLAYTFFCSIEGALMFARVERSREPMDIIVKHCKGILNEISLE
jgi:TetR/AcrR family transcriptional regulator, transcriptional repressor for nem operon